ncbi:MAG TPA: hypothetical protein VKI20_10555, partial [Acidimicrobiales bacterium]|nr:hypothetical protein [Acidimicrobiales bacterium]
AFGFPNDLSHDEALECIELFGQRVVPEFDRDPVHSTTRHREAAGGGPGKAVGLGSTAAPR